MIKIGREILQFIYDYLVYDYKNGMKYLYQIGK